MIRLEQVSKSYGDVQAVAEMSLTVEAGELVVLIGPSGCGKTTTLKMINRLIEPSSGTIFVNGKDTAGQNPETLRRAIGYVIQSIGLFPHMTVRQNIQVVPDLLGWPKRRSAARADELLEMVGLHPDTYRDSFPSELSGGQAQRVGVARALAVDPPVLLMDEPFGAVDPITRERLQDEFIKLQRTLRKTIVMVTHDIDEAIKLADRVCVMKEGRVEQFDTPEQLLAAPGSRFVRHFVGSDRALKRLSRIAVEPYLRDAPTVDINADEQQVRATLVKHRTAYVTREGKLTGWIDRKAFAADQVVASALTEVDPDFGAIQQGWDAKEALARMLSQGASELPVVNNSSELVGRLDIRTILALTGEEEEAPVGD